MCGIIDDVIVPPEEIVPVATFVKNRIRDGVAVSIVGVVPFNPEGVTLAIVAIVCPAIIGCFAEVDV